MVVVKVVEMTEIEVQRLGTISSGVAALSHHPCEGEGDTFSSLAWDGYFPSRPGWAPRWRAPRWRACRTASECERQVVVQVVVVVVVVVSSRTAVRGYGIKDGSHAQYSTSLSHGTSHWRLSRQHRLAGGTCTDGAGGGKVVMAGRR